MLVLWRLLNFDWRNTCFMLQKHDRRQMGIVTLTEKRRHLTDRRVSLNGLIRIGDETTVFPHNPLNSIKNLWLHVQKKIFDLWRRRATLVTYDDLSIDNPNLELSFLEVIQLSFLYLYFLLWRCCDKHLVFHSHFFVKFILTWICQRRILWS